MTRHSEFMMETRPYGGGFTNFVGIKCGWCKVEEWRPSKNGGWAMRVFRATGWKVGNKDHQHRCPSCFGRVINARRTPDNPAIPKEIGKVLKTKILEAHVKDGLLGTSVLTPKGIHAMPLGPDDGRPLEARAIDGIHPVQPEPEPAPAPVPEPAAAPPKPVRGTPSTPGVTMFTRRDNAARAATNATGSRDGIEFYTLPLYDGWMWKHARDVTPAEKALWWEGRKLGPRYHTAEERTAAKRPPQTQPEKETPMTKPSAVVTPIRKDPMPTPDPLATTTPKIVAAVAAEEPRKPTRDERAAIHDDLTKLYDTVDQRYSANESDKTVAERLNVPRAWVTDVRVGFFGDHDRNANTEKRVKDVTQQIKLMEFASTRFLELAAEAETLLKQLVDARKTLEG